MKHYSIEFFTLDDSLCIYDFSGDYDEFIQVANLLNFLSSKSLLGCDFQFIDKEVI